MNSSRSRNRSKSNKPRLKHSQRSKKLSLQIISELFVGCPRCGFFLSGYRARAGVQQLTSAILQVKNVSRDWLVLDWQPTMLDLLERSYGCEVPSDTFHFETRCEACARVLILEESAEQITSLRIQLMPRIRHLRIS